jgi:hypothetical protein
MTSAMKIYRWNAGEVSDWTVYAHSGIDSNADETNLFTSNPGQMCSLNAGFILDDATGLENNAIRCDDGGGAILVPLRTSDNAAGEGYPNSYDGDNLAAEAQAQIRSYLSSATFEVTWDETTRKFTFSDTGNFDLTWTYSSTTRRCAGIFGFDEADLTGSTSYTSDNAVYCQSRLWIAWTKPEGAMERYMLYGFDLAAGDEVTLSQVPSWVGPDPTLITAAADWEETKTAVASGINELFVWTPSGDSAAGYLVLSIEYKGTESASSTARFGCFEGWSAAQYSGTRTFASPWALNPVVNDFIHTSPRGGASTQERRRGWYEGSLMCKGWAHTSMLTVQQILTKHGQTPCLFLLDPDDIREDTAVFARMMAVNVQRNYGVGHVADFTIDFQQIPMHPIGT